MTTETLKGWARAHPAKAISFGCAIIANYAFWLPQTDTSNFLLQQPNVVGSFIGFSIAFWMLATIKSDQRQHHREYCKKPHIGPKLMALALIGSMAAQQAQGFDARLLRPPTPTSPVQQQGAGVAVGIIVVGGGGFFIVWLARKCQQYFGPNGHTNRINSRLDEYGYIEDYISPGGTCPRLAEYNETSLDQRETSFTATITLGQDGQATIEAEKIVPQQELASGPDFARSIMDHTGVEGLGQMRGDPHFSKGNGPIEYGESPIYRDWDGTLVILDTNYWSYPDDVVTVERSPSAEGPWEPVFAARIPRGTTLQMNDSSEGGVQFYRVTAAVQ